MNRRIRQVVVCCLVLSFFSLISGGCGGANGKFVSTTSQQIASNQPNLETETVSAKVVLPSGSSLALSSLTVATPIIKEQLDGSGTFQIQKFTGGSQLVLVQDADGAVVLLGWLREGATVDVHSTANVLLFFSLGASHLPPELRIQLETLLDKLPESESLARTLAQIFVNDPKYLSAGNQQVQSALQVAAKSVIGTSPVARILSTPAPGNAQSGVRLNLTGSANQVSLTNMFRRRAHAFVKRVSYVNQANQVIASPLLISEFTMPPIGGLTNLTGGLTDAGIILLGYENGNQLAYHEQTQPPVDLVPISGAQKTNFKVVVVGPGTQVGDLASLSPSELEKQKDVTLKFVVGDLALQMFFNILLPNSESYQQKINAVLGAGGDTVLGDLIDTAKSLNPNIADKALNGDIVGAVGGAYDLVFNSGTFKAAVLSFFGEFFFNANETEEFFENARNVLKVTGAIDLTLSTFDTLAIGKAIGASHMADSWDLQVTAPDIVLRPENATIVQGATQNFTVTVPEVSSSIPLVYHWSTNGNFGTLTDGQGQHTNTFDSTVSSTTYTAGSVSGQETVSVDVFEVSGPSRKPLGTATATVSVKTISIEPKDVILSPDDSQDFTVVVPDSVKASATYIWNLTADTGTLSSQTDPAITYTVGNTVLAPASDTLTVGVMVNGKLFGHASASIKISDVSVIVSPTSASIRPGKSETFSALALGIPLGEKAVYEWESLNGLGNFSDPTNPLTTFTVGAGVKGPASDTLRVLVYSENSQGLRTLQKTADIQIDIPDDGDWTLLRSGPNEYQIPSGEYIRSLSFAQGFFLAPGYDRASGRNFYLGSHDGQTWTYTDSDRGEYSVAANGQHVTFDTEPNAGGDPDASRTTFKYTFDGSNFQSLGSTLDFIVDDLAYGNSSYLVTGAGSGANFHVYMATSPDLSNWSTVTSPPDAMKALEFLNGTFFAGGTVLATSPDGLNWTQRFSSVTNEEFVDFTYGNGIYVAISSQTTGFYDQNSSHIYYSSDGKSWTAVPPFTVATSTNGTTYARLFDLDYIDGKFYAVGFTSDIPSHSLVFVSDDGANWSLSPGSDKMRSAIGIAGNAGTIVCVSGEGSIMKYTPK